MPAFLRLVECDRPAPLRLTLQNEAGDEIASATAPSDEAGVRSVALLLARSEKLRPRLSAHGLGRRRCRRREAIRLVRPSSR